MGSVTGQRVLITRAAEDCAAWASRLADAGAVPLMLPCIECRPILDADLTAQLAAALPKTDWLVLTSRRGAEALRQLIARIERTPAGTATMAASADTANPAKKADTADTTDRADTTGKASMSDIRIAAVGPATAAAAASLPGQVELVAPSGTARSLAEALAARLHARTSGSARTSGGARMSGNASATGGATMPSNASTTGRSNTTGGSRHVRPKCLIAVAENAGNILEETLQKAGGDCLRINVYRTVPAALATTRKQALSELGADKILLASPSAVAGLVNRLELDAPAEIVTIGPSTTRAARAAGLTVTAEAARPSLEGLMEAMQ